MKKINTIFSLLLIANLCYSQQWFAKQSIASAVLLEKKVDGKYMAHGTGFLLHNFGDSSSTVVTCKHNLRRNSEIYVVMNLEPELSMQIMKEAENSRSLQSSGGQWEIDGNTLRIKVELIEGSTYARHEILDIAALPINIPPLISTIKSIPGTAIKSGSEIPLGTDVYFVGFPTHIGGTSEGGQNEAVADPMLRSGAIASTSKKQKTFLLDTPPFGVNGGSPIFTKGGESSLIGMVVGDLYAATGNTAVTVCYWIDDILDVVKTAQL